MTIDESKTPSGKADEVPEGNSYAKEFAAKLKAAMAKVEAQDPPASEKAKTPATIDNSKKLEKWTAYALNIQNVDGNIKVEITNSEKGKEYPKIAVLSKEKVEKFNEIIEALNDKIRNFEENGSVVKEAKDRIQEIEGLLGFDKEKSDETPKTNRISSSRMARWNKT